MTKSLYDSTPYTPSGTTQYYYRHTYSSGYDLPWSDSNYDDNMVGSMQQYFTSTHLPDLTNNKAYLMMASLYTSNYNNPDSTYLYLVRNRTRGPPLENNPEIPLVLETKARKNNQSNSHGQRRNRDILRQQCRRGLSAFLSSSRPSPEPQAPKVPHPCCSAQSPLHCPTPPKPTHFSALCSQSYSFPLPLCPSDSVSLSL